MYRPALQRDQCGQSLACRRQLDRLLTSVNGELTQQVQREFFGHTLILNPMSEEGMRSPLLVFAALSILRKELGPGGYADGAGEGETP